MFECKPFDFLINRGIVLYSLCLEQNHNMIYENKSLSISNINGLLFIWSIIIGLALIVLICENWIVEMNFFLYQKS